MKSKPFLKHKAFYAAFVAAMLAVLLLWFGFFGTKATRWISAQLFRSYDVAAWSNSHLNSNDKILLIGEKNARFFKRNVVLESSYEAKSHYANGQTAKTVLQKLRSDGFTHVIRGRSAHLYNAARQEMERLKMVHDALEHDPLVTRLQRMRSKNKIGMRFDYTVYALGKNVGKT